MSQVIVEERAQEGKPQPPLFPLGLGEAEKPSPANLRKAVLPLEEGDVTVTYPGTLSERSSTLLTKYLNLLFGMEREVG